MSTPNAAPDVLMQLPGGRLGESVDDGFAAFLAAQGQDLSTGIGIPPSDDDHNAFDDLLIQRWEKLKPKEQEEFRKQGAKKQWAGPAN